MTLNCGTDPDKFMGSAIDFNGEIAPGHPPPTVTIDISKSGGDCGIGEVRSAVINISGELVCCDPQQKINDRKALVTKFSQSCGDFSAGGTVYEGARVQSFDISSSDYLTNVAYTASLTWVDPNYNSGARVSDPVDSVQASETDDSVTVTHVVSATGLPPVDCDACGCEQSEARAFVNSRISSICPIPKTISIPQVEACEEVTTETDNSSCFFSITKTWTFDKSQLFQANAGDLKHSKCTEESTDQYGDVTTTISGNIDVSSSAAGCSEEECGALYNSIVSAVEQAVSAASGQYSGGGTPSVSKSFNDSNPPSGSYTVTIPPVKKDASGGTGGGLKEDVNISISFSGDGVGSVSVSGNVSNDNSGGGSGCLCDGVDIDSGKYSSMAQEYFNKVKAKLGDAMDKLSGPCHAQKGSLSQNSEDIQECKDGTAGFNFGFDDRSESDRQFSWNLDLNRPVKKIAISPTIGGGYCAIDTGKYGDGSINVNGGKNQNCPDDAKIDMDALALDLAQQASGGLPVREQGNGDCKTTYTGGGDDSSFNKSFSFTPAGNAPSRQLQVQGLSSKKNME